MRRVTELRHVTEGRKIYNIDGEGASEGVR